jgi:protein Tex
LAVRLGMGVTELTGSGVDLVKQSEEFKSEVGEFTFADIVTELAKPGRDPRDEFSAFAYREDVHEIKDLKPGMACPGIVTNVTNFGAFVDIGVHQDGLVHISRLSDRFVKDPREVVSPGDRVTVRVLEVNLEKNQIALTMKSDAGGSRKQPGEKPAEKPAQPNQERRPDRGQNRQQNRGPNQAKDQKRRDDQKKPQKPAKVAFNNPFAQLANWGKDDE